MGNYAVAATAPNPPLLSKRDLWGLSIPLMIEQALAMTIGMFDTMMVSSVGEAAVSGVSLTDTINVLILYLFSALATGGAIVAGQYIGARDADNAGNAGKQLILSSALLGLLVMVLGAAMGTVLSRLIGVVLILWKLRNPALTVSVRSYYPNDLDFPMLQRILAIGIPNGLENGLFQLGRIIMTGLVATLGTASIAAHAVAGSLTGLEVIPGQAMGQAIITVVARCAGAKDEAQARTYTKTLVKLAYLFLILLNMTMLLLLRPVLSIYNLSAETFRMANIIMVIHGIGAMTVWPISFTIHWRRGKWKRKVFAPLEKTVEAVRAS